MAEKIPKTPSSGYILYGIGRAAADLVYGQDTLKVIDIEKLPNLHGKLSDKTTTVTSNSTDTAGKTHAAKVNVGAGIPCKWINYFGNRLLPPDIRQGERVLIYRYGDSKDYFWCPTNLDESYRTTEHLILGVSNRKKKGGGKLNRDNTYFLELNTHNKTINIQTSKSNGEKFKYNFTIDANKGNVRIGDDVGNEVYLDSANTLVQLKNKDSTTFSLDKKNFNLSCGGDYTATVTNGYNVTCASYTVNSETNTFNTPMSTFSGAIVAQSLSIGGGAAALAEAGMEPLSGGASATIIGGMDVQGGLTVDTLTAESIQVGAGGINSAGPITAPNLP